MPSPEAPRASFAAELLIADRPVDFASEPDAFGHRDYGATLASLLANAPAPFTIGVLAPWGRGKSTIINALAVELDEDCTLVRFDAWRHEGQALRRHFLKEVIVQLADAKALSRRARQRLLADFDADVADGTPRLHVSWGRLLRALVPTVLLLVLIAAVASMVSGEELDAAVAKTPIAALAACVSAVLLVSQLGSGLFGDAQRTRTQKRLDEPDRFTEKFSEVLADARTRRVVVAIDNLDRCSPDRVLELLGTIKTYLEPTIQAAKPRRLGRPGADAVFVVAVDDDAIRRHLRSTEVGNGLTADAESADAAEEYLRKFFALVIPVRDLLDEDLRDYTRRHLQPVLEHWRDSSREADRPLDTLAVVEAVTFALGRDPRRIKQFINTLTARMCLIAERERADGTARPRIDPPIGAAVEVVTALALIEEIWPRLYDELVREPRLLAAWQGLASHLATGANAAELDAMAEGEVEHEATDVLAEPGWPRFAQFLRLLPVTVTSNLRPFLTLKQSALELQLPLLEPWRAAIANGDGERVLTLLAEAGENVDAYARQLEQMFEAERAQGYTGAAVAVLRAGLNVADVIGAARVSTLVGRAARARGHIESEVLALGPEQLLEPLRWYRPEDACALVALVDRHLFRLDSESSTRWQTVLAAAYDELPGAARALLTDAVAKSSKGSDLGRYAAFLRARPDLLPASTVDWAREAVTAAFSDGPLAGRVDDADIAVAADGFGILALAARGKLIASDREAEREGSYLCAALAGWIGAAPPATAGEQLLVQGLRFVASLDAVSGIALLQLSEQLQRHWDVRHPERVLVLRFLQQLLELQPDGLADQLLNGWRNRVRGSGAADALRYIEAPEARHGPLGALVRSGLSAAAQDVALPAKLRVKIQALLDSW